MGETRRYRCQICGEEFCLHLGLGFSYPSLYQETIKEIRKGNLGEDYKKLLLENGAAFFVDITGTAIRCDKCRIYFSGPDFSAYLLKEGCGSPQDERPWSGADTVGRRKEKANKRAGKNICAEDTCWCGINYLDSHYKKVRDFKHKCPVCNGPAKAVSQLEDKIAEGKFCCPKCGGHLLEECVINWD